MAKVATAFVVVKRLDGSFYVTNSLSSELETSYVPTSTEVRQACFEIAKVIGNDELASAIIAKLAENAQSESEKAASSIRQALSDKGIL